MLFRIVSVVRLPQFRIAPNASPMTAEVSLKDLGTTIMTASKGSHQGKC